MDSPLSRRPDATIAGTTDARFSDGRTRAGDSGTSFLGGCGGGNPAALRSRSTISANEATVGDWNTRAKDSSTCEVRVRKAARAVDSRYACIPVARPLYVI